LALTRQERLARFSLDEDCCEGDESELGKVELHSFYYLIEQKIRYPKGLCYHVSPLSEDDLERERPPSYMLPCHIAHKQPHPTATVLSIILSILWKLSVAITQDQEI
jgi:hypothetical protein